MSKILTVTIPSYNVEKYLPTILPTYLEQSILDDIEILIVNDGSKDRTAEIGEKYQEEYPQTIRVINKENGGHGSTINRGIAEAKGQYFKVIDGDDWVDTDGFIKLVHFLKHTTVDLVMNPFVKVNIDTGEKTIMTVEGLSNDAVCKFDDVALSLLNYYQLHSNTFKTSILKGMHKIDEHCFYVDQEYIIYPIDKIKTISYLDYPVYQYRVGNAEQSMSMKNMQKNREMHKKVIMALMDFLTAEKHTENIYQLISIKIQKMSQLQIDTYFSMSHSDDIKKELIQFMNGVKNKNIDIYKKIPGKKAKCMRILGSFGYEMIGILKMGKES